MFKGIAKSSNANNGNNILVAMDLGSETLRIVAGEVDENGKIYVLAYQQIEARGMHKGMISDLSALSESLSVLVQNFEQNSEVIVNDIILGIEGRHIVSRNKTGNTTVQARQITEIDRTKAIENARGLNFTDGNHVIHVVPQSYETDSSKDITNPIGLHAMNLGVRVHVISCNNDQERNMRTAIERLSSDFKVSEIVYNGLAASYAVLSEEEKDLGVCLIDIGAGNTNVAVYERNKLLLSFGIVAGGDEITRTIANFFGMPLNVAEVVKKNYGYASPNLIPEEEINISVDVPVSYEDGQISEEYTVSIYELSSVITDVLANQLRLISDRIQNYSREMGLTINLGAGFVLTGGVAKMRGMARCAGMYLAPTDGYNRPKNCKTRIGYPINVNASNGFISPDLAVALGLLRYVSQNKAQEPIVENNLSELNVFARFVRHIKQWVKREF